MTNTLFSGRTLHEHSTFAVDVALRAGDMICKERASARYETNYKDHNELVTTADIKVDEYIVDRIKSSFPDHQILSEEGMNDLSALADSNTPLWVVDPIDGTVNFAYGHNQVAVSIAYFEGGEAKVGVVHAPFQKETFHAVRGEFALMNHKPIQVSGQTELRQSLIATGFPYHKNTVTQLVNRLHGILGQCRDIRRIGSAALDICWVAMGRLDGYYETVSPWDFAAARLIASEAGALCGHLRECPENIPQELHGEDIIVTTPAIYDTIKQILLEADSSN